MTPGIRGDICDISWSILRIGKIDLNSRVLILQKQLSMFHMQIANRSWTLQIYLPCLKSRTLFPTLSTSAGTTQLPVLEPQPMMCSSVLLQFLFVTVAAVNANSEISMFYNFLLAESLPIINQLLCIVFLSVSIFEFTQIVARSSVSYYDLGIFIAINMAA